MLWNQSRAPVRLSVVYLFSRVDQSALAHIAIVDFYSGRVGEDRVAIVLRDAFVVEADVEGDGGALKVVGALFIRPLVVFVLIFDVLDRHGRAQHGESWRAGELTIGIHARNVLPCICGVADAGRLVSTS